MEESNLGTVELVEESEVESEEELAEVESEEELAEGI